MPQNQNSQQGTTGQSWFDSFAGSLQDHPGPASRFRQAGGIDPAQIEARDIAQKLERKRQAEIAEIRRVRAARLVPGTSEYAESQIKKTIGHSWMLDPNQRKPVYKFLDAKREAGEAVTEGERAAIIDSILRRDFRRLNARNATFVTNKHARAGADPALELQLPFRYVDVEYALASGDKIVPMTNGEMIPITAAIKRIQNRSGMDFQSFREANSSNLKEQALGDRQRALQAQFDQESRDRADNDFLATTSYLQFLGKQIKNAIPNASKALIDKVAEYGALKGGEEYGISADQILADPALQEAMLRATGQTTLLANMALGLVDGLGAPMFMMNYGAPVMEALGSTLSTGVARRDGLQAGKEFLRSFDVSQGGVDGLLALANLAGAVADFRGIGMKGAGRSLKGLVTGGEEAGRLKGFFNHENFPTLSEFGGKAGLNLEGDILGRMVQARREGRLDWGEHADFMQVAKGAKISQADAALRRRGLRRRRDFSRSQSYPMTFKLSSQGLFTLERCSKSKRSLSITACLPS